MKLKQSGTEPDAAGFEVSRVVFYEGQWIRFGDWYPDKLVRLFRKGRGNFAGGSVHERLEIQGAVLPLAGELHHYTYKDAADQLTRMDMYSTLWAESAFQEGKRAGALAPYTHALGRFLRAFVVKSGFKGGLLGLKIARLNAYEVFLKYKKLRQLAGSK